MLPVFPGLPARAAKPRGKGITHVLDRGLPLAQPAGPLETGGAFMGVWNLGWGITYADPDVAAKLELLARHGVPACPGGTLPETAAPHDRGRE